MTHDDWQEPDPDDYEGEFYDDEGLKSDTFPCPECGQEVYEDAQQCPACGSYITHSHAVAPVWRWTAAVILLAFVWFLWMSLRNLP